MASRRLAPSLRPSPNPAGPRTALDALEPAASLWAPAGSGEFWGPPPGRDSSFTCSKGIGRHPPCHRWPPANSGDLWGGLPCHGRSFAGSGGIGRPHLAITGQLQAAGDMWGHGRSSTDSRGIGRPSTGYRWPPAGSGTYWGPHLVTAAHPQAAGYREAPTWPSLATRRQRGHLVAATQIGGNFIVKGCIL